MRILALADYFAPGYKAGGPIRTLVNMIARLGDEHVFRVVTRDRDLGASETYAGIAPDRWTGFGKAEVFYASPARHLSALARLLREDSYDILYLNSFFSWKSTIFPLVLRRFGLARRVPVILAPRGEFSRGALGLKTPKKRAYIALANVLGLCSRVVWQASSDEEANDIRRSMKRHARRILVAPNLVPEIGLDETACPASARETRQPGPLRAVFLSRISPMKNLDYLLRLLAKVDTTLSLGIYGPIEDQPYWDKCTGLIAALPDNVQVRYGGAVPADEVGNVLAEHDLFIFPTRGENFGHVIIESLSAGTPVLLSDRTPWRADSGGAIEILALEDDRLWIEAINRWGQADSPKFASSRKAAQSYAHEVCNSDQALVLNRRLFESAAG